MSVAAADGHRVQASMRPAVAEALLDAADADPTLMVLGADGHALAAGVRERYPKRYIDVGIAEANLVGVASGLRGVRDPPGRRGLAVIAALIRSSY